MTIITAIWTPTAGATTSTVAVDEATGEVIFHAGPDAPRVIALLGEPARVWVGEEAVRDTEPGDAGHVRNVLSALPGVTIEPDDS